MKNHPLSLKDLKKALRRNDTEVLGRYTRHLSVTELSHLLSRLSRLQRRHLLLHTPPKMVAQVFAKLSPADRKSVIDGLTDDDRGYVMAALRPDERMKLLETVSGKHRKALLGHIQPEDYATAHKQLSYPKDTIGRRMKTGVVALESDWTVAAAIDHIRGLAGHVGEQSVAYVVSKSWKVIGSINLTKLILAKPTAVIEDIMDQSIPMVRATDNQERAVRVMSDYRLASLATTDEHHRLVGVITYDDVADIAEREATEDFQKASAVVPLDVSYSHASVARLFRKRSGWLIGLVLVSLASSGVIAAFEETLSSAIALAFFIPLLIGSGGNAGAQAATIMIRAISLGEVKLRDWLRVSGKEILVGGSLAIALGIFSGAMGFFRGGFEIGLIIGLAMAAIIVVTNLIGTLLPFILAKMRIDPAVASGPLVTSVADVAGLTIYFTIAGMILGSVS